MKSLNILILSSYEKTYSGNLAQDRIEALVNAGHKVSWGYEGIEDNIINVQQHRKKTVEKRSKYRLYYLLISAIKHFFLGQKKWHFFEVENEHNPKLLAPLPIDKINGEFDLIYILFTSFMISAKTIDLLHKRFNCPIALAGVDMYHLTGGCIFVNYCKNLNDECKECPSFTYLNKSRAHKNYLFKKTIYRNSNCVFLCNSWQKKFALQSKMFEEDRIIVSSYTLNEDIFAPLERTICKQKLGLQDDFDTIILARFEFEKRKGFVYLENAINNIYKSKPEKSRCRTLLLTIGLIDENLSNRVCIPVRQLGRVSLDHLVATYNIADLFVSPSIDDAGPSMVNQAMACGTPVLCFNIGTALDVIYEGESGYMVELGSQKQFDTALNYFLDLSFQERKSLRCSTRNVALKYNSRRAFVDRIELIYNKFKEN